MQHDHGTLEAHAVTTTTSKIAYTLFFDNSNMPDEAAKQADKDRRRTHFPPPARRGRFVFGLRDVVADLVFDIGFSGGTIAPRFQKHWLTTAWRRFQEPRPLPHRLHSV